MRFTRCSGVKIAFFFQFFGNCDDQCTVSFPGFLNTEVENEFPVKCSSVSRKWDNVRPTSNKPDVLFALGGWALTNRLDFMAVTVHGRPGNSNWWPWDN